MPQIQFNSVLEHFCEGNFFCAFLWLERCLHGHPSAKAKCLVCVGEPFNAFLRHEEQHTLLMRVSKRPSEGLSLWSLLEPLVASPSGAKQLRRWLQQPSILASPTHHHHLGTFKLCRFSHQNFSPRQTTGGAERTSGCHRATHGIVARLQCRGGPSLEKKKLMFFFWIMME